MPQKRNGKNVDPLAGIGAASSARSSEGFVGALSQMRLGDVDIPINPKDWGAEWLPFPKVKGGEKLFCIAVDGSLPPGAQPLTMQEPTHAASRQFTFFPVCARAVPWPAAFEENLALFNKWTPMASHALAQCAAGFVAALPGLNVGHGADMAPIPSFLSATQAALERPWSEWGFEKLDLLALQGGSECPAETLARFTGNYVPSDPDGDLHKKSLVCPNCGEGFRVRAGSDACVEASEVVSGGQNKWLYVCEGCNEAFRAMSVVFDHIQNSPSQRSMSMMEIMEVLLYVEIAERIKSHLANPESHFYKAVESMGASPLLLVKDGPLVVSPTSKLAGYLRAWAENMAKASSDRLILVGIEKNSALLSEIARSFALREIEPNQYCRLDKAGQKGWDDAGKTASSKKDRSRWAEKFAVVMPQGVCIISTPLIKDEKLFSQVLGKIIQNLNVGAQPTSEGIVRFPLLAHLQKHTALPAKEKAMGRFAYETILGIGRRKPNVVDVDAASLAKAVSSTPAQNKPKPGF